MRKETKESTRFKSDVYSVLSELYDNLESNMKFHMDIDEETGEKIPPQGDYDKRKYEAYNYIIENLNLEI